MLTEESIAAAHDELLFCCGRHWRVGRWCICGVKHTRWKVWSLESLESVDVTVVGLNRGGDIAWAEVLCGSATPRTFFSNALKTTTVSILYFLLHVAPFNGNNMYIISPPQYSCSHKDASRKFTNAIEQMSAEIRKDRAMVSELTLIKRLHAILHKLFRAQLK
jgi:hypothetical protein